MKWTDEEEAELRRRHPIEPAAETARAMGRTRSSITTKVFAMRLVCKDGRGRPKEKEAERVTKWADTYSEIYPQACALYEQNVPIDVKSRWVDFKTPQRRQEYAVFKIYPRNLVKYMREYGNEA